MASPELILPKYISLKNAPNINERWLHDRLIEHPELLARISHQENNKRSSIEQ